MVGAQLLVAGATAMATSLGVSDLVIGLTVVAMGTSLPELVTSAVASLRGHQDIAVGNVIGSNIFNLSAVLGLTATLSPLSVSVADPALHFDIPVMTAVAIACLPIFFTGYTIDRWEGTLFLGYYAAYLTYLVLSAGEPHSLRLFKVAMLGFAIPITALTLAVIVFRTWRKGSPPPR